MTGNRKEYIDWMKALGMLFIIWGHCFPEGMSDFIYAFNVPVFFIISGYLTRRDETVKTCCGKMWDSLMLPYLVLAFAFMVYGIATFNGRVAMYNCLYGDNAFLLALGAILGSMMVLIFAVMLENVKWNGVLTINMGMLVILTFHRELLHPLLDLLRNMEPSVFVEDIATLAFSCLVLVAFVPITLIVKRILPVALGRRRIKQC